MLTSTGQTKTTPTKASNSFPQEKELNVAKQSPPLFSQSKQTIGSLDDVYEKEADAMSDKIMLMQMPGPINFSTTKSSVNRKCAECEEEEKLHRKESSNDSTLVAPPIVHDVLNSGGKSLDEDTRAYMEPRFNYDFSKVKIHDNDIAIKSASSINALAYTSNNNIVFNSGQYNTNSDSGKRLLAHELTHVVQQKNGDAATSSFSIQRQANINAAATGNLSDEMLNQIAEQLRKAMAGWGTDEEAIYSAFAGRNQAQVDAIARVYQQRYNRSLIADLKDELSDDEMRHLAIFSPTAVEGKQNGFAELTAIQLRDAMEGWGTDESSIMSALTGRTESERVAIKQTYKNLTNRELIEDLKDELSGNDLIMALRLLEQGLLETEDQIYFSIDGLGTDEEALFKALSKVVGDRAKIRDLIAKYKGKGYGDLLQGVRDDLSGSDFDKAMEMAHGTTPSGNCSPGERKEALRSISVAVSMAQNAITYLEADIGKGSLSGKTESALGDKFNPGKAAGAVTIGLAGRIKPVFDTVRNDMLMVSDVTCGSPAPCLADPDCTLFTGAWTYKSAGATIRLCPAFFKCSGDQPTLMLHEFVHHGGIADQFYIHQAGFSQLQPLGDNSASDSLNNADSYAHFAEQLF